MSTQTMIKTHGFDAIWLSILERHSWLSRLLGGTYGSAYGGFSLIVIGG